MQNWKIKAVDEALDEFYDLPTQTRTRIREKLRREVTKQYPTASGLQHFPGWYCLRVGAYRIVYAPYHDEVKIMLITAVARRDGIYKKLESRWVKYG